MRHRQPGKNFKNGMQRAGSWPVAILIAGLLAFQAGTASGQGPGTVSVELNRLEQADESCRAYLVVGNTTPADYESLGLDLVLFDAAGIVSRRMSLELAPLPAGKTSVRVFSLEGTGCDSVGRVLLNSVLSCRDGSGERPDCLDLIETSSRTDAPFIE